MPGKETQSNVCIRTHGWSQMTLGSALQRHARTSFWHRRLYVACGVDLRDLCCTGKYLESQRKAVTSDNTNTSARGSCRDNQIDCVWIKVPLWTMWVSRLISEQSWDGWLCFCVCLSLMQIRIHTAASLLVLYFHLNNKPKTCESLFVCLQAKRAVLIV